MRDLTTARSLPVLPASTAVRALPPATRYVLRGGPKVRSAAQAALGFTIPEIACRAGGGGERAALWLGPDEWLLIAPVRLASALPALLHRALGELPHSLVDVSHRPRSR
jgi:sarcosine oxidase subunit gamma